MQYGLFDTIDLVWIGDERGPRTYSTEEHGEMAYTLARASAMVVDAQLQQKPGRTRALPFLAQSWHIRDEKETVMTPLEALTKIERGEL